MKRISDFLGRQVINLAAAKEEGIIINGLIDEKLRRMQYYVLVNEDKLEEAELYLPLKSVLDGTDILYITNSKLSEQISEKYIKCPLNARVFNTDGELIGIIKDIEYDEKGYTLGILTDNGSIAQSEVVIATSSLVTVKGKRPIRVQRKKSAQVATDVEEMMNIPESFDYSDEEYTQTSAFDEPEYVAPVEKEPSEQPPRIISDYKFLLSRKVTKDIYAYGAGMIIPQDTIIDDNVVNIARRNGKLVELTVNSK